MNLVEYTCRRIENQIVHICMQLDKSGYLFKGFSTLSYNN